MEGCGKMKTLDYYMSLNYRMEMVPDAEEGGFAVRFPELQGCVTCGDTVEEVTKNAEECKRSWIAARLAEGAEIPEPDND